MRFQNNKSKRFSIITILCFLMKESLPEIWSFLKARSISILCMKKLNFMKTKKTNRTILIDKLSKAVELLLVAKIRIKANAIDFNK